MSVLLSEKAYALAVVTAKDPVADQPLRERAWHMLLRALYLAAGAPRRCGGTTGLVGRC